MRTGRPGDRGTEGAAQWQGRAVVRAAAADPSQVDAVSVTRPAVKAGRPAFCRCCCSLRWAFHFRHSVTACGQRSPVCGVKAAPPLVAGRSALC